MSRTTHDAECTNCGFEGKVPDEAIICSECGQSIEGMVLTGDAMEAMWEKIRLKHLQNPEYYSLNKETIG